MDDNIEAYRRHPSLYPNPTWIDLLQGKLKGHREDLFRRRIQSSHLPSQDKAPFHHQCGCSYGNYANLHVVLTVLVQAGDLKDIENVMYV